MKSSSLKKYFSESSMLMKNFSSFPFVYGFFTPNRGPRTKFGVKFFGTIHNREIIGFREIIGLAGVYSISI
jgi:hypothetical protein